MREQYIKKIKNTNVRCRLDNFFDFCVNSSFTTAKSRVTNDEIAFDYRLKSKRYRRMSINRFRTEQV